MNDKRLREIVGEEMTKQEAKVYRELKQELTIPREIADFLDISFEKYQDENRLVSAILSLCMFCDVGKYENIEKWFTENNIERLNLSLVYLAGKALGVDLVEVVEE